MNNIEFRRLMRKKKRKKKVVAVLFAVVFALLAIVLLCSFISDTVTTEKQYITYTVRSGDTLWSIARSIYGDSCDIRYKIDHIERENGIVGARIYEGMRLRCEVDGRA